MLPKRKKRHEKKYRTENSPQNWTLQEKRQLLKALKRYGPNRMKKLLTFLPRKTPDEITRFIDSQKRRSEALNKGSSNHPTAPIEQWHYLAQDLVGFENFDYSTLLEKILSMAHDYEEHPTPKDETEPDYKLIYKYLSTLFQADELPEPLPSLEAAIILDLMHGLATKIHTMDTYPQQMIMKWKFALLQLGQKSDRAGHNPGKMKALLNDFSEFMPTQKSSRDDNTMKWISNGLMINPENAPQIWIQMQSAAVSRSDSISRASPAIREPERTVHMLRDNVVRVYPIYTSQSEILEHMQTLSKDATSQPDHANEPATPEAIFINRAKPRESQNSISHQGKKPTPLVAWTSKVQAHSSHVNTDCITHPTEMIPVQAPINTVHMRSLKDNVVRVYPILSSEQKQALMKDATSKFADTNHPATPEINGAKPHESQNSISHQGKMPAPLAAGSSKDQTRSSQVIAGKSPCSPVTSKPAHSDTDIVTSQKSPIDNKSCTKWSPLVGQPAVSPSTSTASVTNTSAVPSPSKKVHKATSLLQKSDSHNAASHLATQGSTKPGSSATEKKISASNCSATKNKLKCHLRFDKPKLFTLNPFVIPSQFLNMKPIDLDKHWQVRRREADHELRKQFSKAK